MLNVDITGTYCLDIVATLETYQWEKSNISDWMLIRLGHVS